MRIAAFLIGAYIRLVYGTSRWRMNGVDHFETAAAEGKGVILAFWHGRLLMAPAIRRETDRRVFMLISAHRDGEIIARGVRSFGVEFIRGSASNKQKPGKEKQGASAIARMAAALNDGDVVGFTPDGPTGPAEKVKPGIIRLAQLSGAPIIPAAYAVSSGKHLKTWDRFLLAAPFSKGYYEAGEAIRVSAGADEKEREMRRAELEAALRAVTARADALAKGGRNDL
ncbi:lysophospholipid acyltransferase family protein [Hyphococcus sp.]|uniref:lysophospholipid acyltransferase family protein n=1 Tax=Hyphococcus sp. TaxID=2038636 RepID=UPI003CCC22EF